MTGGVAGRTTAELAAFLDALSIAAFLSDGAGGQDGDGWIANSRAAALVGAQDGQWLMQARFHAPGSGRPLSDGEGPAARLRAAPGGQRLHLGWIDPRGDDHVLLFETVSLPGRDAPVIVLRDVTESWALHENLDRSERLEAIGQMTDGLCHELGNILGVIQLSADTGLLSDPASARQFRAIQQASARGAALNARLLALGQGAPAGLVPGVELAGELTELALLARHAIPGAIALKAELAAGPLPVAASAQDIRTAVLNLLLNARNALQEQGGRGGRILLRLSRKDGQAMIEVADTGPGMSQEQMARACDPFYTTRRDRGGSGMGLPMVATLAEEQGGTLQLRARDGGGMSVRLCLPLLDRLPAAEDGFPVPDTPDALTGLRVLVVEDDAQMLALLRDSLQFLGAEVTTRSDAASACALLEEQGPCDLLLTDMGLAGAQDGAGLALAARHMRPGLPVLYMTSYDAPLSAAHRPVPGLVLRKPMSLARLSAAIRLSLGR